MPGFSISLLLLPREDVGDAPTSSLIVSLLDDKADAPGWRWSSYKVPSVSVGQKTQAVPSKGSEGGKGGHAKVAAENPQAFVQAISRACEAVCQAEPEITRMDTIAGDGDCGLTLKAGAEGECIEEKVNSVKFSYCHFIATLAKIKEGVISGDDIAGAALAIADVAEAHMGGTSGALYSCVSCLFMRPPY